MKNKDVTIEDLARMVHKGFEETAKKSDILRLENRLDRIERLILDDHKRRIEKLEMRMEELYDTLALK